MLIKLVSYVLTLTSCKYSTYSFLSMGEHKTLNWTVDHCVLYTYVASVALIFYDKFLKINPIRFLSKTYIDRAEHEYRVEQCRKVFTSKLRYIGVRTRGDVFFVPLRAHKSSKNYIIMPAHDSGYMQYHMRILCTVRVY